MPKATHEANWQELFRISVRGKLAPGDQQCVAQQFKVSLLSFRSVWRRGCEAVASECGTNVKSRACNRGRKKIDRVKAAQSVRAVNVLENTSQRLFQAANNVTSWQRATLIRDGYINRVRILTRPLLTQGH
ncbi:TPA: hypothetical protein N0F65_001666 [Lagenidium giganteum]|uniref:Transposase n=1 Tax=Lagenidium giganteum TaxID=4803 RepID=A0AAV2YYL9_9STRA|nr:TPA: hypothetical protein N0F65_001666 [Lagenidium giganteum]